MAARLPSPPATIYANLGNKTSVAVASRGLAVPHQQVPSSAPQRQATSPAQDAQALRARVTSLERQFMQAERDLAQATLAARGNPLSSSRLFRGLSLAAGGTLVVKHGLGRAFVGWFVTRCTGVARSSLTEGTAPAGVTDAIALTIANSGGATAAFDLMVF